MLPVAFEKLLSLLIVSSKFSSVTLSETSASTPFVLPVPSIKVLTSEIFPLTTSNFTFSINSFAVLVLNLLAPAPTGSSKTTCPNSFAFFPAANIDGMVFLFNVPILMFKPPQIDVISSTSSISSDIIGLPPQASKTLATSFTVT